MDVSASEVWLVLRLVLSLPYIAGYCAALRSSVERGAYISHRINDSIYTIFDAKLL